MTALYAFGIGGLLLAGLIALAIITARKRGQDAERMRALEAENNARKRMAEADVPRTRDDVVDRLRGGRF